jgi:hypothetical protein
MSIQPYLTSLLTPVVILFQGTCYDLGGQSQSNRAIRNLWNTSDRTYLTDETCVGIGYNLAGLDCAA